LRSTTLPRGRVLCRRSTRLYLSRSAPQQLRLVSPFVPRVHVIFREIRVLSDPLRRPRVSPHRAKGRDTRRPSYPIEPSPKPSGAKGRRVEVGLVFSASGRKFSRYARPWLADIFLRRRFLLRFPSFSWPGLLCFLSQSPTAPHPTFSVFFFGLWVSRSRSLSSSVVRQERGPVISRVHFIFSSAVVLTHPSHSTSIL